MACLEGLLFLPYSRIACVFWGIKMKEWPWDRGRSSTLAYIHREKGLLLQACFEFEIETQLGEDVAQLLK